MMRTTANALLFMAGCLAGAVGIRFATAAPPPTPTPSKPVRCDVVSWNVPTPINVNVTSMPGVTCACSGGGGGGGAPAPAQPINGARDLMQMGQGEAVVLANGPATITHTSFTSSGGGSVELMIGAKDTCTQATNAGPPGGAGVIHVPAGRALCAHGSASGPGPVGRVTWSGTSP